MQFPPLGRLRGRAEVVRLVVLACELTRNDAAGAVPCGAAPMRPFGFVLRMPAGVAYLKKLQSDRVKGWAAAVLPGPSDLNRPM